MKKKKTGKITKPPVMFAQYYKAPGFYLYHGNCLEVLAKTRENSIDMIFADPPYNLSNGGFTVHAGKRVSVHKGDWDKSNELKYEIIV